MEALNTFPSATSRVGDMDGIFIAMNQLRPISFRAINFAAANFKVNSLVTFTIEIIANDHNNKMPQREGENIQFYLYHLIYFFELAFSLNYEFIFHK